MIAYTILPESLSSKKNRSGKLRMRIRVYCSETNKTYTRKNVVNLTASYVNFLVEKVTNHVNKINKLKEELSILEKTRI